MAFYLYCIFNYASNDYDICFTTPLAVMTLRLFGLGIDIYDGHQKPSSQDSDRILRLYNRPSLLEFFSFTLSPFGSLVGPQFSFKDYSHFISDDPKYLGRSRNPMIPLSLGFFYLLVSIVSQIYMNPLLVISSHFFDYSWLLKIGFIFLFAHLVMCKYFAVYLIQEAISAYGCFKPSAGIFLLENVNCLRFELATSISIIIESFNINTNRWVKYYVFKRMKFLGSRRLSLLSALTFLAIWHGFHVGYFECFFLELLYLECEKKLANKIGSGKKTFRDFIYSLAKYLTTFAICGYALISFELLLFQRYSPIYSDLFYMGHIFPAIILILVWK